MSYLSYLTHVAEEVIRVGTTVLTEPTRRAATVILPALRAEAAYVARLAAGVVDSGEDTVQNEETTQHG